jgi:hypothetical protein
MGTTHTPIDMLCKNCTQGVFGHLSSEAKLKKGLKESERQRKLYSRHQ